MAELTQREIEQQIVRAESMQRDGWDMSVAIQAFRMAIRAEQAVAELAKVTAELAATRDDFMCERTVHLNSIEIMNEKLAAVNERAGSFMGKLGTVLRNNGFNDHDVAIIRSELTAALSQAESAPESGPAGDALEKYFNQPRSK